MAVLSPYFVRPTIFLASGACHLTLILAHCSQVSDTPDPWGAIQARSAFQVLSQQHNNIAVWLKLTARVQPVLYSIVRSAAKGIAAVRLIVVAVIPYIYFVPDIVIGSSTTEHTENLVYVLYIEGNNQLTQYMGQYRNYLG